MTPSDHGALSRAISVRRMAESVEVHPSDRPRPVQLAAKIHRPERDLREDG
jgi:hypothetical protein